MSRSCHSATFSSADLGVAAQHAREAAMRSLTIGLRLCGIALEPFWPGAERLLDLAHLGALQVADLGREPLQAGAGQRDGLQQLGVAVARHDLRGDRLGAQAQALEHARLEVRADVRVGADRAGDLADRGLLEARSQPLGVAVGLEREAGELEPERGRLGVDAVGAADAQRVDVLARPLGQRGGELARAGEQRARRPAAAAAPSAVSSTSDDVRP